MEMTCPACGKPLDGHDHTVCAYDPPRVCPSCGRKLRVQVVPDGYRAACVVCGPLPRP
jgi:hypothetical protein